MIGMKSVESGGDICGERRRCKAGAALVLLVSVGQDLNLALNFTCKIITLGGRNKLYVHQSYNCFGLFTMV